MEQNFNTYNAFPNDQNDDTFGALSGPLLYPSPFQTSFQQQWPNTPGWQSNGQDNYNYYPGQLTGSNGYFANQQDFLPYDEGEDFYNNEDEDTEMEAQHPDTEIMGNSGNNPARQPQVPLRNPTVVPGAAPHSPKTQNQSPAGSVTAEGSVSKPISTAINDRAAELRAKLLAKRTVGSGTPTPEIKAVKSNSSADGVKAEPGKPTERVDTRSGPVPLQLKSRGYSELTKGNVPAQNKTDDKSTANSIAALKERTNSSADIDGLFAETRAAMAAEDTQKKSGERGEKTRSSAVGQAAQASARTRTETKTQTDHAKDSRRSSLNESLGSSGLSEQGEIREDQPKEKNPQPSEPVPSTPSTVKPGVDNEERTRRSQANSTANKPLTKQIDTRLANGHRNGPPAENAPSIPPSSAMRGLPNTAPLREAPGRPKVDRQDHYRERPLPAQDRRQLEPQDARAADKAKNDSEHRRNQEIPYRRSSNSLAAIEANERAAAEYNRRNQKPVAAPEPNEGPEPENKRSVPKPRLQESGAMLAPDVPKVTPEQQVIDYIEDLDEWLQMTGYHDRPYRKKALARHRKLIALDLQRAELEREAQVEHEERSHLARGQSIMPRESVETSSVRSVLSPRNIRTSSIFSMPPPPLPIKESHYDVGVKIKDLASRESLGTARRVEDDLRAYKNMQDSPTSTAPTLKRRYADKDQDSGVQKPVEKMARIDDAEDPNTVVQAQTSPYGTKSAAIPLESRISTDTGMSGRDRRRMSRSPEYRRRSMSPQPRRLSGSDMQLRRQMSGGSFEARNGHSPVRRSFSSRDSSPVRRGRDPFPYNDYREDPYMRTNYEKKPSSRSIEYQPYVSRSDYQQSTSNRGRGKGFRGAYINSRGGGYSRTFRPGAGSQDDEHAGSTSLDLKAGDSRYFIIKSWNYDNVKAAQMDGTWATQEHNLEKLTEAFNTCRNVILVFSVNKSAAFQGYVSECILLLGSQEPGYSPPPVHRHDQSPHLYPTHLLFLRHAWSLSHRLLSPNPAGRARCSGPPHLPSASGGSPLQIQSLHV
ncbi:MAG: YTH-domain-containing protein [Lasallia pustulata]|uniref:YTH-domain-containing protein n=1 Tax=Lasallia pustulata TaxID=136370 RepID=A0A5M8Q264_9LECA|nr:MAG: YTH-domain-containing protein [Lasallia pustulata]